MLKRLDSELEVSYKMLGMVKRAVLLAAASLLFAGLSFGQMGTFTGKVVGPDGKPLQGAVIKIERTDIKGNWQTKSNRRGEWIYSGMPVPGQFRISCEVDGRVADVINGVRSQMGDPVPIHFDLHKIAQKQAAMQKAAQSGQITEEMARDMSPEEKAALEKQMKERSAQLAKNKALNDAFNMAMAALQTKDFQVSVDNFNKAAEMDPKQYAVWANMAAAYEGLANTKAGAERDDALTKACDAYTKALALKPDDAGIHNNYGLALAKLRKLDEAKAELAKAAQLDPPGAGKYYFNLGAVMVNTGQGDAAVEAFKQAVTADPNYADAWYYMGNVLSGKMSMDKDGKPIPPEGMKDALEKYLALRPDGPHAEAAKGLLSVITTTIETTYTNPDAKKAGKRKK
jgi:Tfp pilus assembly protein PilF